MNKVNVLKAGGISLAVLVGSTLAVTAASAHHGGTEEQRAEKISNYAEKNDVSESEAEAYFEEKKATRQAERGEKRAEHIAGLIETGTLTQTQANELTILKDGFKGEVEALKESGAEREEIKAAMEENRSEVEAWAEAQGINLDDIKPERGEGERKGQRGGHGSRGGGVQDADSSVES